MRSKLTIAEANKIKVISLSANRTESEKEFLMVQSFCRLTRGETLSLLANVRRNHLKEARKAIDINNFTAKAHNYLDSDLNLYEVELNLKKFEADNDFAELISNGSKCPTKYLSKILSLFCVRSKSKFAYKAAWETITDKDRERVAEELKSTRWEPAIETFIYIKENYTPIQIEANVLNNTY